MIKLSLKSFIRTFAAATITASMLLTTACGSDGGGKPTLKIMCTVGVGAPTEKFDLRAVDYKGKERASIIIERVIKKDSKIDAFVIDSYYLGELMGNKYFTEAMLDLSEDAELKKYYDSLYKSFSDGLSYKGKYFGVTADVPNANGWYLNRELAKKVGLDDKTPTWKELEDLVGESDGSWGLLQSEQRTDISATSIAPLFSSMINAYAATFYDYEKAELNLDTEEFRQMLRQMKSLCLANNSIKGVPASSVQGIGNVHEDVLLRYDLMSQKRAGEASGANVPKNPKGAFNEVVPQLGLGEEKTLQGYVGVTYVIIPNPYSKKLDTVMEYLRSEANRALKFAGNENLLLENAENLKDSEIAALENSRLLWDSIPIKDSDFGNYLTGKLSEDELMANILGQI